MKRLLATITAGGILLAPAAALANPAGWTAQLSSPFTSTSGKANTRNFNLSVSATSVNSAEILTVNVYQNSVLFGTFSETSSTYGGSWNQPVAVSTDGDYVFKIVATNSNGDADKSVETTVSVDTAAPSAPSYLGKTRSGNSYEVKFTAPSSADVSQVRVYAATSTSFTANSATQVGVVSVTAGQTASFTYSAPDANPRYFAVQAYDGHGNGSTLAGDAVTTAGSASTTSTSNNSTSSSSSASNSSQTGSSTTPAGLVEATQTNNTDAAKNKSTSNVASTDKKKKTNWTTVAVTLVLLGALYVGYQWFMQKADQE